jgi:hypothetical protein
MWKILTQTVSFIPAGLSALLLISCASLPTADLNANQELRQKISRFPIGPYAGDLLAAADAEYASGSNDYSKNNARSGKSLLAAREYYEKALAKALPLYFKDREAGSRSNWGHADLLKAHVCLHDRYTNAEALYQGSLMALSGAYTGLSIQGSNTSIEYFPLKIAKLGKKERERFFLDQSVRREALLTAADLITRAESEFARAHEEAKEKKSRADLSLDQVLRRETALEAKSRAATR